MKITNIRKPEEFFRVLAKCEGDVFLVTDEGDVLNLRSKLMQYVAMATLFSEAKIDNLEIKLTAPQDLELLIEFLIQA